MYSIHERGSMTVYQDGIEDLEIKVTREQCLGLIGFEEPPAVSWPGDFQASFGAPMGTPPLHELAQGAGRVAVIVPDSTRGVPTARVMPMILEELGCAGVRRQDVIVVIATGVHRPATEEEVIDIVGPENLDGITVMSHDPYDAEKLVYIGKTLHGTPVEVSRAVLEADLRIAVGKVEPHEFAGFSGGRKLVLPGIASERTIGINHRPEMLMSPEARPGQLLENPIHQDMIEAAGMMGIHFTVNLVLNQAGETIGIFTGDLLEAHLAAVSFMRSFCQVTLANRPDIIVTTPGRPLNINFYQSVKPLIALAPVMEPGGILVLYSACRDGLGTEDMLIPYEGARDIGEVIRRLNADYRIQMDHALLLGKILLRGIRIVVATPSVDASVVRKMFLETAESPQAAVDMAMSMAQRPDPTILFFPQAQRSLTVLGDTART